MNEPACFYPAGPPRRTRWRISHFLRDHLLVDERPDAEAILHAVDRASQRIGPDGILIISFATHGLTYRGEHRLLTVEATSAEPHGIVLPRLLERIRDARTARLLLLIDACRTEARPGVPWPQSAAWRPQLPPTFLEDVQLPLPYAVLGSTGPGGVARSSPLVQNGCFTRAVMEGLRGRASTSPDGSVTLNDLETYVSDRVRELSDDFQQPESRMGGLGPLRLTEGDRSVQACTVIEPKANTTVGPRGIFSARIRQPELFATVIVCAETNNVCYNQNPEAVPIATRDGEVFTLAVQYGAPGKYAVHLALSADSRFLAHEWEWPYVPTNRIANRQVYWCGPILVTMTAKKGNPS